MQFLDALLIFIARYLGHMNSQTKSHEKVFPKSGNTLESQYLSQSTIIFSHKIKSVLFVSIAYFLHRVLQYSFIPWRFEDLDAAYSYLLT